MFSVWRTSAVLTAALCLAHTHMHTGWTVLAGDVSFSDSLLAPSDLTHPVYVQLPPWRTLNSTVYMWFSPYVYDLFLTEFCVCFHLHISYTFPLHSTSSPFPFTPQVFSTVASSLSLLLATFLPPLISLFSPLRDQRSGAALPDDEGHSAPLPQGELRGLQICYQPLEQVSDWRLLTVVLTALLVTRSYDPAVTSLKSPHLQNAGFYWGWSLALEPDTADSFTAHFCVYLDTND